MGNLHAEEVLEALILENGHIRLGIDRTTGALVELLDRKTGWAIQGRPALAKAFTAVVPLPGRILNQVDGSAQAVTVEGDPSGTRATVTWRRLVSPHCGAMDITLTADVTLGDAGVSFRMTIENNTDLVLESLCYPYIGDLSLPPTGESLARVKTNYCGVNSESLYPTFRNERGYWGVDYPIKMVPTPVSPLVLVQGEAEGLYIGHHDTEIERRADFTFQLKPGCGREGVVPEGGRIGDQVSNLEVTVTHHSFVQPGETLSTAPVVLEPYMGDWHSGVDIYKQWRTTWMRRPSVPEWLAGPHSWQQIQMTSWGDSLRIRYDQLVAYAKECKRHGVEAIQLVGWTYYGQDGRLPIHATDPRLGTHEELKVAIREIRKMGVKVVLYEKYTCADVSTDEYKDDLHRLASKDIFGNTHGHGGWQYHTPAHLSGINTRPYAWMCMNSPDWQDVALSEIEESLELEPAGILLDESQWHGDRGFYCYDTSHGHHVPAYNFGGDPVFERRLRELVDEHANGEAGELVMAGEGPWDLQYRHYNLSYIRTQPGHRPFTRYVDPDVPIMSAAISYDDRESINRCLLYRYIISYEPMNFKGHLEDFPLTLEYGKKVDALRKRYRDYLWDAECRDTIGAAVAVESGDAVSGAVIHSVFRRQESGLRAVVIANHHEGEVAVRIESTPVLVSPALVSPEKPDPVLTDPGLPITVPARSVVILLETAGT